MPGGQGLPECLRPARGRQSAPQTAEKMTGKSSSKSPRVVGKERDEGGIPDQKGVGELNADN